MRLHHRDVLLDGVVAVGAIVDFGCQGVPLDAFAGLVQRLGSVPQLLTLSGRLLQDALVSLGGEKDVEAADGLQLRGVFLVLGQPLVCTLQLSRLNQLVPLGGVDDDLLQVGTQRKQVGPLPRRCWNGDGRARPRRHRPRRRRPVPVARGASLEGNLRQQVAALLGNRLILLEPGQLGLEGSQVVACLLPDLLERDGGGGQNKGQ